MGVTNFFIDPWNKLDLVLVSIALVLELLPHYLIPNNSDVILKMSRIFRITTLIKNISKPKQLSNGIYIKVTHLISQTAIIVPIVLRFIPLYMITFYVLGSAGVHIFKEDAVVNRGKSPYDQYELFNVCLLPIPVCSNFSRGSMVNNCL